ncbi:unannotated protein [freshwater metagenome]|uniref:Unannotated protein n=1 Tax=freshwater metagenome TaxID=449393 RepID=A0A6J7DN61_9ZZZZ
MALNLFDRGAPFDEEELANRYRHILSPEDRDRLPAYAALCDALAESRTALELLGAVQARQQNPTLILAILHYLALTGHLVLGPLYGELHEGHPVTPEAFARSVIEVLEAEPALLRRQLWRSTQTNEPNRSAVLAAAIGDVARTLGHSQITLIDVGTSMGFNLFPDHVTVLDRDQGDDAALVTECFTPGFVRSPVPFIGRRVGLDQNLLHPTKTDDVAWLTACLWPEESRRLRRFTALLEQMKQWPEPVRVAGNAVDLIDYEVTFDDTPTYVINSWVLAYFSLEERAQWRNTMDYHFAEREDLVWISMEHPSINDTLRFPEAPKNVPRPGASEIVVTSSFYPSIHWGWSHPHGHWFSVDSGPKA